MDTPETTVTEFTVKEDALATPRLGWDKIEKFLLDPSLARAQHLTLAQVTEAAENLPPLSRDDCEKMGMTKVGEYLLKVFTLADFAVESTIDWINSHMDAVTWLRDKTRKPGRRLPLPGYPTWTEVKKKLFPKVHPNYVDQLIRKAAAEEAKDKGEAQEGPQPAPVVEKPESHWDEDFAQLPVTEMPAIIHAALKHGGDFADVTKPLGYNEKMSLLSCLLKSLACSKKTRGDVNRIVAKDYHDAQERKKKKAKHQAAVQEYDASAPEREKVRKEEARKPKAQPAKAKKAKGGKGEATPQGGNGEARQPLPPSVSNPPVDRLYLSSGTLGSTLG